MITSDFVLEMSDRKRRYRPETQFYVICPGLAAATADSRCRPRYALPGAPADRRAWITLSRNREPDAEATLGAGTFVIPAIVGLSETSSHARLTAHDAAGNVLERLPYRQRD